MAFLSKSILNSSWNRFPKYCSSGFEYKNPFKSNPLYAVQGLGLIYTDDAGNKCKARATHEGRDAG